MSLAVRFAMEHEGLFGTVDDLYVAPSHRRRGVATALLDALRADAARRGCRALCAEVGASNAAAVALYTRAGLGPPDDDRVVLCGRTGARERGRGVAL